MEPAEETEEASSTSGALALARIQSYEAELQFHVLILAEMRELQKNLRGDAWAAIEVADILPMEATVTKDSDRLRRVQRQAP